MNGAVAVQMLKIVSKIQLLLWQSRASVSTVEVKSRSSLTNVCLSMMSGRAPRVKMMVLVKCSQ